MSIKVRPTKERPSFSKRESLPKAFFDTEERILRVIIAHDHLIIICQDVTKAEALFSDNSTDILKNKGFDLLMPPELKAT